MATCDSSKFSTSRRFMFLRKCGRLIMVPVICLASIPAYAQTWLGVTDNGTAGEFNWTTVTNWSGGIVPDGASVTATFGVTGGNINLDTPIEVGTLEFNSGAIYNLLGGANQLTFNQGGAGLIDIDAGEVSIATDLALTVGGLNIDVAPAPVVSAEISGAIGGDGPVTKLGLGTLVLSGANTYSNSTVISVGTLQLGVAGAIPDGSAVSVAGGATFDLNDFSETIGSLLGAGSVTLGTGNLTTGGNGNNTTFSGVISETGDLIKEGTGVFTLAGANTYTGDTRLNAGTLSIGSAANLGSTAGDIIFDGGTLRTTASMTVPHDVLFNAGGGTIETVGGLNTSAFTGEFTGAGTLTKDGLGTLLLTDDVAGFNGNIVISDGDLNIQTFGNDVLSSDITGTGDFIKSGTGILGLSGNNNAHVGATRITGGRLRSLAPGVIGDVSNVFLSGGGVLDLNGNDEEIGGLFGDAGTFVSLEDAELITSNDIAVNESTFGGTIIGNMDSSVIKRGDGFLRLTGDNTFEGELQIQSGRVALNDIDGNDMVLADRNRVTIFTDAELVLYDILLTPVAKTTVYSDTIGPLSGNGDVDLGLGGVDSNTLTVNSENPDGTAADTTFSGRIIGDGGLTKVGLGTLTLSGANTYLGTTQIDAGTLQLGGDDRINDMSAVRLSDSGTFDLNGFNETIGSLDTFPVGQTQSSVMLGAGTLTTGGDGSTTDYEGVISGTGGLTKEGAGVFTLSGMNTYTGTTAINGGTLQIGIEGALADTTAVQIGPAGILDLNDFNETIGSLSGSGGVTLGPAATGILTTGGDNSTTIFSGVISGTGGLVKEGTGTFTVSGANTYTGPTMVNAGTLQLGAMNALPDTTAMTVAMGGTFDLNDFSDTIASLSGAGSVDLGTGTLTTGDATNTEFSGIISGTGGLVKEGTGTFTLSGMNTYSGGTAINAGILFVSSDANLGATGPGIGDLTFNGGTLTLGADVTTARDVTLLAGGGTIDTNTFNGTMSGIISGAGGLTKTSLGTLTLNGINTYTGGTNINGGVVSIGNDNNLGGPAGPLTFDNGTLLTTAAIMSSRNITLNAGGGTVDTNGFDSQLSGDIAGAGDLNKNGPGILTLSGTNTYSGATNVNAGVLAVGSSTAVGDTSAVTVATGATFDLNGFDETIGSLAGAAGSFVTLGNGTLTTGDATALTEFAGVISGTGGLTKQGTGIFRLSGMNTYTGPTTINTGTLELGADNVLSDSTAVTVAAGAVFDVNNMADIIGSLAGAGNVTLGSGTLSAGANNTSTTYSGIFSGTGQFIKVGTGTMILTGVNTHTGGTAINGGTLSVGNDNNLGDAAGLLSFDGGTLLTTANITSSRTVTLNAGGGTIDTNTFDSTLSGVIGGVGSLTKNGLGTLTLGGANTYTGGTTINAGTVSVSNDNNLGNAASTLTFDGGTLLTTAGITSSRDVTLNAGGGTIDTNSFDSIFSGAVTGPGDFTKDGAGTLTFSGPLDGYTGDTTINAGILDVDTTVGSTSLSGDVSGPGGLTKSGINTLTLTGNLDAYTGDTVIDDGTLEVDTTAGSTNLNGNISGAGNLTKSGSNTLTLFGMNTYSGNTLVDAGTLMLGAAGGIGDDSAVTVADLAIFDLNGFNETIGSLAGPDGSTVTLGAGTLTTGGNDSDTEFAGVISGTGAVVKEGSGTFTLSGVNTYFGGTTINDGTVSVGNDNNLGDSSGGLTFDDGTLLTNAGITSSRAVTLNAGGGTVDTNTFDSTLSGVIDGVGSLTKNGLGTLTLSGVNTYTGGTTINDGTVSVSNDNNLGNVAGTLTFDGGTLLTTAGINSARSVVLNAGGGTIDTNSFDSIFSSVISGAGALNKNGLGTLTLDGVNTYTGNTTVNAGRLDVNGSTTSNTTVLSGATLGGNGTITGDVTIDAGGTMAPGNSIGQTNIVGNYTQNTGSTFELELRPVVLGTEVAGVDFDQTNVTGTATVNPGTTVNVIGDPGVYQLGSQYRFLQTTDGLTGSYDTLTGATFNNGLLQGTLFHDANNAELRITNTNFSSVFASGTKNQQSVAAALDDLSGQVSNDPGSDGVNVLNQLLVLPSAQMATAVQQIGGASLGADRLVALQSSFDYLQALKSRIRTGLVNNDRGRRDPIWVQGLGTFGNIDGNADSTGVDYTGSGIMFGIDQGLESGRQGISVGINQMDIDNQNGFDNSEIQSYNITAYISTIADPVYIMAVLGYGRNDFDSTRQLTMLDPDRTAAGSTSGNQLQALLEYGLYVNTPVWDTQVYISGQYVGLQQDDFTEIGADSMNLSVDGRTTNSFRAAAGMRLAGRISEIFEPEFHAGIVHELLDPDSMTTATFDGSTASFAQCGIQLPNTMAQFGVGATAKLGDSFSIFGGYDALLSGQQINHAISATGILNY